MILFSFCVAKEWAKSEGQLIRGVSLLSFPFVFAQCLQALEKAVWALCVFVVFSILVISLSLSPALFISVLSPPLFCYTCMPDTLVCTCF